MTPFVPMSGHRNGRNVAYSRYSLEIQLDRSIDDQQRIASELMSRSGVSTAEELHLSDREGQEMTMTGRTSTGFET
jgi:hypothetical protein